MKKSYEKPLLDVLYLSEEDIVRASGGEIGEDNETILPWQPIFN